MKNIVFETYDVSLPEQVAVMDMDLSGASPAASRELRLAGGPVATAEHTLDHPVSTQPFDFQIDTRCDSFATGIPAVAGPVDTIELKFQKLGIRPATYSVPITPLRAPEARSVPLYTENIKIYQSIALDDAFITLEMINLRFINFPRITEFITRLAEEHKLPYSQVKLIGIYEPVPLHLAYDMKLDPVSGKLRYRVRPPGPKDEKRFARVAYARVRLSDKIISTNYPVT